MKRTESVNPWNHIPCQVGHDFVNVFLLLIWYWIHWMFFTKLGWKD